MKVPRSARKSRIAFAVTGPTSGSVSSSACPAVLMFTIGVAVLRTGRRRGRRRRRRGGQARGARTPTTICSPSTSTRARLSAPSAHPATGTPGRLERVDHPRPEGQLGDPGSPYLAGDVHHDAARRLRGGHRWRGCPSRPAGPAAPAAPVGPAFDGPGAVPPGPAAGVTRADGLEVGVASGRAASVPPARVTHQPVSASPPLTTTATTTRCAVLIRTRPCRVGGSRSSSHPLSASRLPTGRWAWRPHGCRAWLPGSCGPVGGTASGRSGTEDDRPGPSGAALRNRRGLEARSGAARRTRPGPGTTGVDRVGTDRGELGAQQLQPSPCHLGDLFVWLTCVSA